MMTRRRDCTCAGTAPGYPQHEDWCGRPERPYEPEAFDALTEILVDRDEPVEPVTSPGVELMRAGIEEMQARIDANLPSNDPPLRADRPELHSVATIGVPEQKPSLSDCLRANGVPRQHWDTVSAAVAVWMRAWFSDYLNDDNPDGAA